MSAGLGYPNRVSSPRPKKKATRREPKHVKKLKQLHKAGLLTGLTVEALEVLHAEVEIAAEERERDPNAGEDDPRNYEDRWLDRAFQLYLLKAGLAEGALTSSASPADLSSMLAGARPAKVVLEESGDTRAGRMVRLSFPGSSRAPVDMLCTSTSDLAGVANFALAQMNDDRRFVECHEDPRFYLAGLEKLYLLASFEQRDALVEQGIIRDDERVTDVVEPIAGPPQVFLKVEGVGGKGAKRLQTTVLAMPRGGKWHIQGSFDPAPAGPIATDLSGDAYTHLYEIRGWRPSPNATRSTFSGQWDMKPGVLLAIVDGGDDEERAEAVVRAALNELKRAASESGTGAPTAAVEAAEAVIVTALIGEGQLLVRQRTGGLAIVVRDGEVLEPGADPLPLEPGDVIVLGSALGAVPRKELLNRVGQVGEYQLGPVELLVAEAAKAGAVRPALTIALVALKQRGR